MTILMSAFTVIQQILMEEQYILSIRNYISEKNTSVSFQDNSAKVEGGALFAIGKSTAELQN